MWLLSTLRHISFMSNGLCYLNSLDRSISNRRGVWLILLLLCFIEIPILNPKIVDPDRTPRFTASDLDVHCLPVSLLGDFRHR